MAKFLVYRNLSEWIVYPLQSDFLEPPEFKVKLKYLNPFELAHEIAVEKIDPAAVLKLAVEAITKWDVTDEKGAQIDPTRENKAKVLKYIGGDLVEGRLVEGRGVPLVVAIIEDARKADFFFKDLKDSVIGTETGR